MKVTHISTSLNGGAGKAVIRLHEGLAKESVESAVLSLNDYPSTKGIHTYASLLSNKDLFIAEQKNLLFKIKKVLNKRNIDIQSTYFSLPTTAYKNIPDLSVVKDANILHLHWISNFIDLKSFMKRTNQPIVWTLHDMNPFSAGYHYLPTEKELTKNKSVLDQLTNQKLDIFKNKNIHYVYTSKYMGNLLEKSAIGTHFSGHHIPLGLDTTVFSPRDVRFCKSILGIPTDKKVVLIVGDDLKSARKGMSYIKDCIAHIKYPQKDLLFCVLGHCDLAIFPEGFPIQHLGYFKDELMMSMAYSCADVFVTTATQEAFGQTTIEALCCGKPVIGFPVGIIPEAIQSDVNGYICETYEAELVAENIDKALNKDWDATNIRTEAIQKYNLEAQATAYAALYKQLQPV